MTTNAEMNTELNNIIRIEENSNDNALVLEERSEAEINIQIFRFKFTEQFMIDLQKFINMIIEKISKRPGKYG